MHFLGLLLALTTLGTLIYAAYVLYREHAEKQRQNKPNVISYPTDVSPLLPYFTPPQGTSEPALSNEEKGRKFEQFVVGKFDKNYFLFLEARSDKHFDGVYPVSNTFPDLAFRYQDNFHSIEFAVECKWRSSFSADGHISIHSYQMENYYSYQEKKQQPVFIIFGIGGTPDAPEKLYIVPLSAIPRSQETLDHHFLAPYRKFSVRSNFFLYADRMALR